MSPQKHHIRVDITPNSRAVKTIASGTLKISEPLQSRCEKILEQYEKGEKTEARKALRNLLEKNPDALVVKQLNTVILYKDGRYNAAYRIIRELNKSSPASAGRFNLQGLIERHLGLFEEAVKSYQEAIRLKPDYYEPYNNQAIILRYFGKSEQATEYFRKAISLNPKYPAAIYNLSCMKGYMPTAEEIAHIEGLLLSLDKAEERARCHFALYNAYQIQGRNELAFRHLGKGNQLMQAGFRKKKPLSTYVDEIKKNFNSRFLQQSIRLEDFYKDPVFIVGMPRSGSSLLEQMLASHPRIYGLGESKTMPETLVAINRLVESNIPVFMEAFGKLDAEGLKQHVESYRQKIDAELSGYDIYTDKMLKNFKTIGFIRILLPNARFIHIRRHPLDNCLACYEKKFTLGHEYTYDLQILGAYYSAYLDLMDYWKSLFPESIHELKYEELVHKPEQTIGACLEFIGLEMDRACLEFYKSDRNVYTASTDQVREKISTRSIGKWKKFAGQLQPLIDELKRGGVEIA